MLATDSALPRTRARRADNPAQSSGSATRNCSSGSVDAGSVDAESMVVPLASTSVIDSRVRYVFCSMPHAMPLELLAMTPPMVQAISLAGSGPS